MKLIVALLTLAFFPMGVLGGRSGPLGKWPPTNASFAPAQNAATLYEKAVAAYERDDWLKALTYIDEALKKSPDNRQAQKLKSVIESNLLGGRGKDGNGKWTYVDGDNTLQVEPAFLHIIHTAAGAVDSPAYATMALQLNSKTTSFEVVFSLKLGTPGSLPTGVLLLTGTKVDVELLGGLSGREFGTPERSSSKKAYDREWHDYQFTWRNGMVTVLCDGHAFGEAKCPNMPDMLYFGGAPGKTGRQTEAYFQWLRSAYSFKN